MTDTTETTSYDALAAANGWTITRESIMGKPCTVYQRGKEVAVWWPNLTTEPGTLVLSSAVYRGRVIRADLANYLVASPPKHTLTQVIETDQEGIIAHLAAMSAERLIQAKTASLLREQRRLSDEAEGIDLAVSVVQSWTGPPPRAWQYGLSADEWFRLASLNTESEIAPCCGNLGELRDLLRELMQFQSPDETGWRLALGKQILLVTETDGDGHDLQDRDKHPLLNRVLDGIRAELAASQLQVSASFPAPEITADSREEP